jgi:hypothetical protein
MKRFALVLMVALLFAVAGCDGEDTWGAVSVSPASSSLHVGATQTYMVEQDVCFADRNGGDCGPSVPSNWTVAAVSGAAAIEVTNIRHTVQVQGGESVIAAFDVHGVAGGDAVLEITGEQGVTTMLAVTILP